MQQNKDFLFPVSTASPISFSDLLQKLFFEEFNGRVDIHASSINGTVFIENGDPVHAQSGKKEGDEALLELLPLSQPTLKTTEGTLSASKTIGNKLESLLIESALRSQNISHKNLIVTTSTTTKSSSVLEIQNATGGKVEFPLLHHEVSVGRSESNVLSLPDISLSSHHALIFTQGGSYHIKDLNSSNGTFLNGNRIRESLLKNGDQIQLGKINIVFLSRLKRPQIQAVTKVQLKHPLAKNAKKMEMSITKALRLGENAPQSPPPKTARQKNVVFFVLALLLLLIIGGTYFFLHK
jgi:pSer/pThr/pTyr-binding forkhead associated (FHA) protein